MGQSERRVVIVGAGYAGLLCAARLARRLRHTEGRARVAIVDPRTHFSERVRLHEDVAGGPRPRVALARLLRGTGTEIRTGWVSEVDLESRRLRIDGSGDEAFDDLVIATGSTQGGRIPGAIEHARSIATEEDARALLEQLDARPDARVVICGGGLTGIELAAELGQRRTRSNVTLVTSGVVGPSLGSAAQAHVRRALEANGVRLLEHVRIVAIEPDAVIRADGGALPADIVVWCGGLRASALPRRIGLTVDADDRAVVDERLRSTSHPFVHVIGDAARCQLATGARPLRMACATANPMGAFCGDDIAREILGRPTSAFRFAYALQCLSLGRRDAVIQKVDSEDAPLSTVIGHRPAAWFKEALCRYAVGAAGIERAGLPYLWPRGRARLPDPTRARLSLP